MSRHVWGMSGTTSGAYCQQWTKICGATCICDAVFSFKYMFNVKCLPVDDVIHNWLVLSQLMVGAHEWCWVSTFSGNLASSERRRLRSRRGMPDSLWSCPRDPVNVKVNIFFFKKFFWNCQSISISIRGWLRPHVLPFPGTFFLAVQNSSIGDLVTHSLTNWLTD